MIFPISTFLLLKFHFSFSSSMIIQCNWSFNTCILMLDAGSVIRWDTYNFFEYFLTWDFFWFLTWDFWVNIEPLSKSLILGDIWQKNKKNLKSKIDKIQKKKKFFFVPKLLKKHKNMGFGGHFHVLTHIFIYPDPT